jgi:hypothetical protein
MSPPELEVMARDLPFSLGRPCSSQTHQDDFSVCEIDWSLRGNGIAKYEAISDQVQARSAMASVRSFIDKWVNINSRMPIILLICYHLARSAPIMQPVHVWRQLTVYDA